MYKDDKTNAHRVLEGFDNLVPSMKFTLAIEQNKKIYFLDITATKNHDGLSFKFYRKPTATDSIMFTYSCHPREQHNIHLLMPPQGTA